MGDPRGAPGAAVTAAAAAVGASLMACQHEAFAATVNVTRIADDRKPLLFVADVRIQCAQCGEPFRFLGLPAGLNFERPMVSVDGLNLSAPIEPELVPMLATKVRFTMPPEIPAG